MRKLLFAIPILAALGGCQLFAPLHKQTSTVGMTVVRQAERAARVAVDEANAALTALNRTIATNVKEGIWTKERAQEALNESKIQGARVDAAASALVAGLYLDAQNQAELAKKVITTLHKKAAEKAGAQ